MDVKLNQAAFDRAKQLIEKGRVVADERDAWSEHQPSTDAENRFIEEHGRREYGLWYLGRDTEAGPETKQHYKFPYGDFTDVHRCGVLSAESRAAQRGYDDIANAAAHLHGMLEGSKAASRR